MARRPRISVILIVYDMPREAPRTVASFLPPFQAGLADGDVEILVLENGSSRPIPEADRQKWPACVRYFSVPDPRPSPARALNLGARLATAPVLCPCIDGARMASPGLLSEALRVLARRPDAFVASLGAHLGPKPQQISTAEGYDAGVEDRLLAEIDWRANGYRLFDIAAPAGSAKGGWLHPIAESNAPALSRARFEALGGFDEAFAEPGGGLVNLDFYRRAVEAAPDEVFLIAGEATFHQVHGGASTSAGDAAARFAAYAARYEAIRGAPYAVPQIAPRLCGRMGPEAAAFQERVIRGAVRA